MKKQLFVIMLMLTTLTTMAQTRKTDPFNERFFEVKVREMVFRLNITDEQKSKFVPIYRQFTEEMIAAGGERERPEKPTIINETVANLKKRMERQQRAQDIRMRYIDKFATVLDASQLSRFFDVEKGIQKKLRARKNHHQDPKGNRPRHHMRW